LEFRAKLFNQNGKSKIKMAKFSISQTSKSFDTLNSELSTANFALAHLAVPLKECAVEFLVSVQARA